MDDLGLFIMFGAIFALGLVLYVAQLADADREDSPTWRGVVIMLLVFADVGAFLVGSLLYAIGRQPYLLEAPADITSPLPGGTEDVAAAFGTFGLATMVLAVIAGLTLIPTIRRLTARAIPIDPERITHAVALQYAALTVAVSVMIGLFIEILAADPGQIEEMARATGEAGLAPLWYQNLGFALLALLGVGTGLTRGLRAALERLGLTPRFDWIRWVLGTGGALLSMLAVEWVWGRVSPESLENVNRIGEALFGSYLEYGILAALTIGLSAGIGEELLFRGAAQPRLGLVFTSLLFAAIHTQYTVSLALVQVLIVSLLLGWVRRSSNTTTAIGVHATYNFTLVMIALLQEGAPLWPGGGG